MVEEKIGIVEHFFTNINVAAIKITDGELTIGDTVHFVGAHADFTQHIDHMEINRAPVQIAKKGDAIGIKVQDKVREHDIVYKIPKGETA
ncbi:MAG TPA: translation elongation factor-like protein [Candidatus Thermoplasmatota archaeon]|nr:translation elongation factor-like protein [Candidatus Thermoplasmatota archaeon]